MAPEANLDEMAADLSTCDPIISEEYTVCVPSEIHDGDPGVAKVYHTETRRLVATLTIHDVSDWSIDKYLPILDALTLIMD